MSNGTKERDAAIARVEKAADPGWCDRAYEAVADVAERLDYFTADDVWDTGLDTPREGRAMGAVMVRAKRDGLIEPTWHFEISRDPKHHRAPNLVWHSLVAA